uniref:Pre-mRNA-splicing regulator WTAP n=1 Tax=Hydra vulgaris TaxID=6087 RepID=T2MD12_HYDVU
MKESAIMEPFVSPPPPPPLLAPTKIILTLEDKETMLKEEILKKWDDLQIYVKYLEQQLEDLSKPLDQKLKLQQQESARKENLLVMRLASKEQEMQELVAQNQELKQAQTPSMNQLQSMLIDPAVNLLFEKMKTELTETKDRLEQAQNDLNAWKFTPDSVTGKKLMAKCRMLIQENQELGMQLSQGRIAQLEAELSLQRKYSEELKASQDEMNEFVIQLDEDMEGMQATICALQQQLKDAKTLNQRLEQENKQLRKATEYTLSTHKNQHFDGSNSIEEKNFGSSHLKNYEKLDVLERNHLNHQAVKLEEDSIERTDPNDKIGSPMSIDRNSEVKLQLDSSTNGCTDLYKDNEISVHLDHSPDDFAHSVNINNESSPRLPKGVTKTSFSITDLLADSTNKESCNTISEVTMEIQKREERNGVLSEADGSAV